MTEKLELISEALVKGQANRVKTLTEIAIENGIEPMAILEKGLLQGMEVIGKKFRGNSIFIADVLIASRAMHAGLNVLKTHLSASQQILRGRVVIGTVAGDLHDIGKNLVVMMLRGSGLDVVDLGVDVDPEEFAKAVLEYQPDILGMSVMLTTNLYMIPEIVNELERRELRKRVKIIVGGGPVTKEFSQLVKADGFAADALAAVDLVNSLLEKNR
ncbi:cobalamin-dependent protein [Desulfolucanica intricata]|uniref:cobalamin-dependent protein n=1 Tax=Desulfolucanica intricata TaxID=1285191 RepID=UPI00082E0166|nr:cobalamin-dependent protein [Desulfolucanica intricata]